MRYSDRPAGPLLRALVDRFWVLETDRTDAPEPSPVLPDGHVELLVHLGQPFAQVEPDGSERTQSPVLIAAQLTEAAHLVTRPSAIVAGARLRPHAGAVLTGTPQSLLTGGIHDAAGVSPDVSDAVFRHLSGRTDPADIMRAFEVLLTQIFARRIAARQLPPESLRAAVSVATRAHGLVRVDALASVSGLSHRQLERQFAQHVGLTPKRLLRTLRFQRVLAALREPGVSDWPDLAVAHGFYDQAHFINDFRAFTGTTPAAWDINDESLTAVFAGRLPVDGDV
jgi:AraC-like DNA-binding protein